MYPSWCVILVRRKHIQTYEKILAGKSDANIAFADLTRLLLELGFELRIRGDHHIFWKDGIAEIINLQPIRAKAKTYQVRQVRGILEAHQVRLTDE